MVGNLFCTGGSWVSGLDGNLFGGSSAQAWE
jgi:hypothetical protein